MEYNVAVNSYTGDTAEVTVNGVTYTVKIGKEDEDTVPSITAAPSVAGAPTAETATAQAAPVTAGGNGKPVNSPLPGVIVAIKVKVGEKVKAGQVVAILEAMKMENEIQAESDGTVTSINVSEGDSILEGAPIVTIG